MKCPQFESKISQQLRYFTIIALQHENSWPHLAKFVTDVSKPTNQPELKVNTCYWHQTQENACKQVTIILLVLVLTG